MPNSTATQIPVKIHVQTNISDGNEQQTFELFASGQYYQKQTSAFLQYDEVLEEGTAKTTLKISDVDLVLSRTGAVQMLMKLNRETRKRGSYKTPYGEMELITKTKHLQHDWNETTSTGSIEVTYELTIQGDFAGTYQLQIKFEEEQQ